MCFLCKTHFPIQFGLMRSQFFKVHGVLQALSGMQQLQNFIFYVVFQQALMFYNKLCNFSCATTV